MAPSECSGVLTNQGSREFEDDAFGAGFGFAHRHVEAGGKGVEHALHQDAPERRRRR